MEQNNSNVKISKETLLLINLKAKWNEVRSGLSDIEEEYCTKGQQESLEWAIEVIDEALERAMVVQTNQAIYDSGGTMI